MGLGAAGRREELTFHVALCAIPHELRRECVLQTAPSARPRRGQKRRWEGTWTSPLDQEAVLVPSRHPRSSREAETMPRLHSASGGRFSCNLRHPVRAPAAGLRAVHVGGITHALAGLFARAASFGTQGMGAAASRQCSSVCRQTALHAGQPAMHSSRSRLGAAIAPDVENCVSVARS